MVNVYRSHNWLQLLAFMMNHQLFVYHGKLFKGDQNIVVKFQIDEYMELNCGHECKKQQGLFFRQFTSQFSIWHA